ncbi:hypothetical protein [Streptomyces sp. MH60]|uniref:hypothetical protein n=1 Tax=Streptomyces sp. MH60 TaxID=1940758 RepID=UPI0010574654|nr:hypothetical protein [Streptomyces sp. MH60]
MVSSWLCGFVTLVAGDGDAEGEQGRVVVEAVPEAVQQIGQGLAGSCTGVGTSACVSVAGVRMMRQLVRGAVTTWTRTTTAWRPKPPSTPHVKDQVRSVSRIRSDFGVRRPEAKGCT